MGNPLEEFVTIVAGEDIRIPTRTAVSGRGRPLTKKKMKKEN